MYQQPNHSYHSTESLRRMSSNNPFRNISNSSNNSDSSRFTSSNGTNLVKSPNSKNFENWVTKNKKLMDDDDDNDLDYDDNYNNFLLLNNDDQFSKPQIPTRPMRSNSDSSVKMSSNNPFASALNDNYVHHRDPPPIPRNSTQSPRPPKSSLPPPSYEEAAGRDKARKEYPREKSRSDRSDRPERPERLDRSDRLEKPERPDRSRTHRSHSDSRSERHRSHRRDKEKEKSKSKSKKPEATKSKNLDTIDKLDVTAFFGSGFHHDGPFDACTPHRNKNVKAAPVMAFPVDGPNNSIKGLSNIDKDQQMNLAFGTYSDQNEIIGRKISIKKNYSKSSDDIPTNSNNNDHTSSLFIPKQNPSVINFDATLKAEPVHGISTAGLGSSTFLDGAPAPKQDDYLNLSGGGLGRKKSLVQRLRKNSGGDGLVTGNSNDYLESSNTSNSFEESTGNSLLRRVKSLKVGRRER